MQVGEMRDKLLALLAGRPGISTIGIPANLRGQLPYLEREGLAVYGKAGPTNGWFLTRDQPVSTPTGETVDRPIPGEMEYEPHSGHTLEKRDDSRDQMRLITAAAMLLVKSSKQCGAIGNQQMDALAEARKLMDQAISKMTEYIDLRKRMS